MDGFLEPSLFKGWRRRRRHAMDSKALLATTDMLVEGIHFQRSWIDPYHLGKKALHGQSERYRSHGGNPRYFLISLGLPKKLPLSFVSDCIGESRRCETVPCGPCRRRYDLIHKIVLNICLLGEGNPGGILLRSGAKAGDDLWVSGTLGDAPSA